jgi:hypothetical protein
MAELLDNKEVVRELVWAPGTDPIAQASLWVPERLYPWQVTILRECMTGGARVAVVTPNESGKTSVLLPVLGLSFMAAFPGCQVVSTAGVERQIKENLWPVLKGALRKYPNWKITEDLSITAPAVDGIAPSTWKAFATKDPNYAEGFHSRLFRDDKGQLRYAPLVMIIDEAKSFQDDAMFRAYKRCSPDVWVVISTPGEDAGPFHACFHEERNKPWKCHEVTWSDCPHLRTGFKLAERQEEIERRGENDPFVMSWIFGKFFRRGAKFVFDSVEKIDGAMSGLVRKIKGPRKVALDFSGGGDEQVLAWREGNHVKALETWHETDTTRLGDIWIARFRELEIKAEDITADNGGLGKPCIDYLERKGFGGIRRYMGNAVARDETRFRNRISEDYFELKFRMDDGVVGLPKDEMLQKQMRRRQYVMPNDDSNRIAVEPKQKARNRGEESPDRLDAVVMLCSDLVVPNYIEEELTARRRASRCGDMKDCFKEGEAGVTGYWGGYWGDE